MSNVSIRNVTKIYPGDVTAVRDASLEIKDGEFLVLVGPSGCGKSTTLRMVAGLEEISGGTIEIGGRVVNDVPPKDRDIAMVFQNYALYPHMTVRDNMAFGLKLRKFKKDEITRRVTDAARILGLEEYLGRRPKALSGGQRQRVAMGRAIVRDPAVFLFDEPLSNLDAKMRVEMRKEILQLHKRIKTTVIYVTHDQIEAMTLGDRICVMNNGVIEQVGDPTSIFDHPATLFVARFIGTPAMNIFDGVLRESNGKILFDGHALSVEIPESLNSAATDHITKKVCLGLRPKAFSVVDSPGSGSTVFEGNVDVIELLGEESMVHLSSGPHRYTISVDPHLNITSDDIINISPDMTKAHIFDAESGRNMNMPAN